MTARLKSGARISLGTLGVTLVLFGLWASLISVIVGVVPQSPNPYVPDGDPCCGIPDTWAQTRVMAFFGWLWLGAGLVPFLTGTLLIAGAARGKLLRWRWLGVTWVSVMAVAAVAIAIAYVLLDEVPQMTDCRAAKGQIKRFPSTTGPDRRTLIGLMDTCDLLTGLTSAEVRSALGPPSQTTYRTYPATEVWHYEPGKLTLRFGESGRVLPDGVSGGY